LPTTQHIPADDTRLRLLRAAGEIFAEQGFRQTTVREICEKAGANVAAVNYHFGDKLGLYAAVVKHWFALAWEKHPPDGGLSPNASPKERLQVFIRSWLWRMMDNGAPAWYGRLIAREMADPTPSVTDAIIESHIRPHSQLLRSILIELLGPGISPRQIGMAAASIAGQCLFYFHCRDTIRKLQPVLRFDATGLDDIASHITSFSLAGMGLSHVGDKSSIKTRSSHNGSRAVPPPDHTKRARRQKKVRA
jgi:AcrR family transcriptional regulator